MVLFFSDLFHLASALKVHLWCIKWQSSPFYGWIVFHCMHLFIHSSISGHIACFSVLALVNNAAVNVWMQISFSVSFFIFFKKKYPEVGLLDPRIVLFLIFWGTSLCFSLVAVPIYVPTNRTQGFSFLYILPNIYCFCLFNESHSDRWEVTPHYGLHLHVTGGEWWWVPFHIPTGHLHVFSGKMSIHILCRFF